MLKQLTFAAVGLSTLLMPLAAHAGEITHRETYQEQRIIQGVESGQINRHELKNLEHREASIAAERYRLIHDGNGLQPRERRILDQRLNNVSHSIYHDRHN